ncbi:MAG: hemerythrin domain-containing protein [Chloroflexota bacterium]
MTKIEVTSTLMEEHRLIERLLRVLESAAGKLERSEEVSPALFARALDFIRNFADRCHHGKEEDCLFHALEAHGLPRHAGPVAVMLSEHEQGREYVRRMTKALDAWGKGDWVAAGELAKNARGYAALLASHIPKEDNILYPMGENILPEGVKKGLLEAYEGVEKRLGEDKHHEYTHLIEELEKELKG